jgi:AcrR family transcriptional regulator
MQAIRSRAGVSNGSLFHHFRTRQDLAAAVVGEALEEHQRVLLCELDDDAELGITSAVRRHLRWVDENRQVARLLLTAPPDVLRSALSGPVLDSNRRFFAKLDRWLSEHGWRDQVPLSVVLALWIGPAQEFSRQRLSRDEDANSEPNAADALAAGAWAALRPLLREPQTMRTRETT